MKPESNNYIWAIVLSVAVLFAWQYYFGKSAFDKQRQAQIEAQSGQTLDGKPSGAIGSQPPQTLNSPPQGGVAPASPAARRSRQEALGASQRVAIETPTLLGSIALTGAELDDLALKDYRETPDKKSPLIELLSPSGAPAAYYVGESFVSASDMPVPGKSTVWTKSEGDKLTPTTPVTLTWDNGKGLVFKRKFAVDDDYMFTITQTVANNSGAAVKLTPYSYIAREGTPPTSGYSVLHEGFIGYQGDGEKEITYAGIEKEPGARSRASFTGGWAGFTDKYWATAMVPQQTTPVQTEYSVRGTTDKTYQTSMADEAAISVPPGGSADVSMRVFAGAKVSKLLDRYRDGGIKNFNLLIDWGYLWFLTQPMAKLLGLLNHVLGNMGVAIIALTFLVKLVFFPLANRSYLSMAKMKAAQPQMAALKERFPDDKMRQQQEMMKIYKAEKINPIAGCLPMVIQIPVFFALYKVLFVTIEMRQAPFVLWIRDLSQPDPTNVFNLFGLIPFNPTLVPFVGHFLAIGLLPIVMGISMFVQMKMNPEPTDPTQKVMFAWMPVVFTFMLGSFPSGLVVYWTTNNTLTIIQQSLIMKRAGVKLELFDNLRGMFRRKPAGATKAAAE